DPDRSPPGWWPVQTRQSGHPISRRPFPRDQPIEQNSDRTPPRQELQQSSQQWARQPWTRLQMSPPARREETHTTRSRKGSPSAGKQSAEAPPHYREVVREGNGEAGGQIG